jgi:pilus assembly protein CpaE
MMTPYKKGEHQLPGNHRPKSLTAAVITVCVEPGVADQFLTLVNDMPWSVTTSRLDSHISATRRPSFGPQMKFADLCIGIVDFDEDPKAAGETAKYLQQAFPGNLTIVGLATSKSPELLLLAMRAGCSEFFHKPLESAGVKETLGRIQDVWSASAHLPASAGLIVSVLGAKGGVGATTLAVHLGIYLAKNHKKRTLLIDFHPELGHACVYLGLDGTHCHFQEVVRNVNRLDTELLSGYVAKHSSGLEVLSSPDACGGSRPMDTVALKNTLEFLQAEYDYIVVDCANSLTDLDLAVIACSTTVYLIATPEVGAIRDLSRYVDKLTQMKDMSEKTRIIVNRFPTPHTVNIEQIEKAVRMPIDIRFAANSELMQAGNLGQPVAPNGKSDFSINMTKWAAALTGAVPSSDKDRTTKSRFAFRK